VLTQDRLDDLVPIEPARMEDRQIIEWDKDDIDALKFMKVDVLGLGMLGCMNRAFNMLADMKGIAIGMADLQKDDPAVYAMIQKADTLGTFQIESRAQMSMLPRIKPAKFYDLVIEVAIVRPGRSRATWFIPICGAAKARRSRNIPSPSCAPCWKRRWACPLSGAGDEGRHRRRGLHPAEADQLRRAMATFKMTGGVSHFYDKLVGGMVARGYSLDFAERTFKQIEGFGSYGFPESHAASFAKIAYASCWMKHHHPDVFCASLLNAQPMGFYAPAQIVADARKHGVEVRPVSINPAIGIARSNTPRRHLAVRLGFRQVRGWPISMAPGSSLRGATSPMAASRRSGGGLASPRGDRAAGRSRCLFGDRAGPAAGALEGQRSGRSSLPLLRPPMPRRSGSRPKVSSRP
jgi:error-prone DNA polymerase